MNNFREIAVKTTGWVNMIFVIFLILGTPDRKYSQRIDKGIIRVVKEVLNPLVEVFADPLKIYLGPL